MINKDKIFVFLVVLFSIIVLFSVKSFASTETFTFTGFDNVEYEISYFPNDRISEFEHFILIKSTGIYKYHIFAFNGELHIDRTTYSGLFIPKSVDRSYSLFSYRDDNLWYEIGQQEYSFSGTTDKIIYSCLDLSSYKNELNGTEDFFSNPLPVTLAPVVEKTHLEEVLTEILKILPVVLLTLVGLIGLRKALAMLSTLLRRS